MDCHFVHGCHCSAKFSSIKVITKHKSFRSARAELYIAKDGSDKIYLSLQFKCSDGRPLNFMVG